MGLLIYIKTTLRNLYSTLLPNLSIFVIIPIFIGLFMGILSQENEKSPLDLKPLKIEILDKDKTEKSKALIKYLEGQKEFLEISKGDEENILIIPKGFKDDIKNSLILKVKEESIQQKNLETLIYEYMDKNEDNTSYIEENIIKTDKTKDSIKESLSKALAFTIGLFIYNSILSNYMEPAINVNKRNLSMPLSKGRYFIYDFIATIVYAFIIIFFYTMIIRIFNMGFNGNLLILTILIFITAFFMASISNFIMGVFSEKLAKVLGGVFLISLMMEIFEDIDIRILECNPTHYLIEAFKEYSLYGYLQKSLKELLIIFTISIVLFIITYIVKVLRKEEKLR
ncbi:MAG: ABC transporter permease [Clostridium sp.]|nr:ABC transporter permease [Clostridium sp.]MCI7442739.1 ABC transporter permease [Clostridium sp.]